MWNELSVLLLAIQLLMLMGFVIGRFRKKKLNETFVFLGLVFACNLALYVLPYLHSVIVLGHQGNYAFDILKCIMGAVKLFMGEVETEAVADFAQVVPSFTYTYLIGALLALLATITTAVETFSNSIINSFRVAKCLKAPVCDLVLGNSSAALQYAKNGQAVLLLDDGISKAAVVELMEKGYVILRRGFSPQLLVSRLLNVRTRYNFICPEHANDVLDCIDQFITYKKAEVQKKQIYLYVELDDGKAETIRREIVEKSGFDASITTFCSHELMARTFIEEHPVTRYIPRTFIAEDASVKPDVNINVFYLGFGSLNQELYRQSVLNNQLVKYEEGTYRVFPVRYRIYDPEADDGAWNINGLKDALQEVAESGRGYFPVPELPYDTCVTLKSPCGRETLREVKKHICTPRTFSYVIIDTGDSYRNIETGARLRTLLDGCGGFRIFVRSDSPYATGDDNTTYFGDYTQVFTHDVIVNDSFSIMARKLNEVYTAHSLKKQECKTDFGRLVTEQAQASWAGLDRFTRYSNIYGAINLRVKLNMLGLDYAKDGQSEYTALIAEKYQRRDGDYTYAEYFDRSKRNALLAQEHARWNAYHLLAEYLPLEIDGITVRMVQNQKVRFNTKNIPAKKHACLTTFKGLDDLSAHLAHTAAEITGAVHHPEEYDYYVYDEMLIMSAEELMIRLGYSIREK